MRRAILIARQCDAAITLLHVVEDAPSHSLEPKRRPDDLLDGMIETLWAHDRVPANFVVAVGDPAREIDLAAEGTGSSIIVMGPHRRQVRDIVADTLADRVIRSSRYPVLLANALPANNYRQSLLAIDFDDASCSAVTAAEELPFVRSASLSAVHLFDAPAAAMMKRSMQAPEAVDEYVDYEARRAAARLRSYMSTKGAGLSQPIIRPHHGSPKAAIISCADELEADLIIVGTNQREGVSRYVLGSIARDVLLASKRDVLVVPASVKQPVIGSKPFARELACVH